MLRSIKLEKFRGFEHFELADLSRVNLLVGKNNCGKTSVLEAVYLLGTRGDPRVLSELAWRRGEVIAAVEDSAQPQRSALLPDLSHFFHGHDFGPDSTFSLSADEDLGGLNASVVEGSDIDEEGRPFDDGSGFRVGLAVRLEGTGPMSTRRFSTIPVTEDGASLRSARSLSRRAARGDSEWAARISFITPDSFEPDSMSDMWDSVIRDGRESEVIEAMKILEPRLGNLFFLAGRSAYGPGMSRGGILVALSGMRQRVPLGSFGDGMRRLLALSLALIRCEGGFLLIDEIDTGLHYSVMGDMWSLVTEAAKRADVQVLATTHRYDCVEGLARLCENHPELGKGVSLQKIHTSLDRSVALDAEQIVLSVNQDLEVR